jgi:hypothetical protein
MLMMLVYFNGSRPRDKLKTITILSSVGFARYSWLILFNQSNKLMFYKIRWHKEVQFNTEVYSSLASSSKIQLIN